ncbi:hypothetical protein [Corynebacterium sp.]|uniref:hypothetical protein n=1 Tax=Corynebacterium sp. TaxID=1720 RepID=UPI0026DBF849|nr:hypothetical protein [Corynebacterium sp.]MDO4610225.1 hypothetical protein [Corynebacterium sp.]
MTPTKSVKAAPPAPRTVIAGAWIGILECAIGLGYGVLVIVRDLRGFEDPGAVISGWGTGLWFLIIFGAVLAGAVMLLRGRRWGRGPIVMLNLCTLGVAYYMATSHAWLLAAVTGLVSLLALYCMFNPRAVNWAADAYGR